MTVRRALVLALALAAPQPVLAQTSFLDLAASGQTYGSAATLTGTLNGVGVTISITSNDATTANQLTLNATGLTTDARNWGQSVTDGTSVQYNHAEAYSPSATSIDQVGYSKPATQTAAPARVTITFATPIAANTLRFHVANLDQAKFDFSPTANLTGLTLRSGNGGGGDGMGVSGKTVADLDPTTRNTGTTQDRTYAGLLPTTGARSAYGTVDLNSALPLGSVTFDVITNDLVNGGTDSGSFTLSVTPVPEPATVLAAAAVGLAGWRRWRR